MKYQYQNTFNHSGERLSNSTHPTCIFRPGSAQLHSRGRDPQRRLLALRLQRDRKENARRPQPFDRRGCVRRRDGLDFAGRWLGWMRIKWVIIMNTPTPLLIQNTTWMGAISLSHHDTWRFIQSYLTTAVMCSPPPTPPTLGAVVTRSTGNRFAPACPESVNPLVPQGCRDVEFSLDLTDRPVSKVHEFFF